MKNKLTQVLAIIGGIIIVAGLFYYLGNRNSDAVSNAANNASSSVAAPVAASNSNTMTRDKAAALVLAYLKEQQAPEGMIATDVNGFSCGNGSMNPDLTTELVNQGYVSETTSGAGTLLYKTNYAATAKANPYIVSSPTTANYDTATVLLAQVANVAITGIADTSQNNAVQVNWTATYQLTPFGVVCSSPTAQSGIAILELFDDGWRVVGG